jgi:phospholipid/cholesterol/gamma-HCH transport system substrate-binding protein
MAGQRSTTRVGILVLAALGALAAGVFLIGDQNRLFSSKSRYTMTVLSAQGLNQGNPVRLNGVTVGVVERIILPSAADRVRLTVRFSIERRYSERIREDSRARIRTLGLLGDKYVEVTSGSAELPRIEPGGEIQVAEATDVEKLISSGEDVVDNVSAISHSLRNVLERVDRGEGVVGELTTQQEQGGRRLTDALYETFDSIQAMAATLETGQGPLARLINDEKMGQSLASSMERLDAVLTEFETGEGLLPALLDDASLKTEVSETLAHLRETSRSLRALANSVESSEGLFGKLVTDEEYGAEAAKNLEDALRNLSEAAEKLNKGEGTAALLLSDPRIYEAVDDILVGVEESKFLSWLIRNRQKKGIELRYDEAQETSEEAPPESLIQ